MPDGFDPHRELERIYTLKELMTACRQRVPVILQLMDEILNSPDAEYETKLKVMDMALNRGYGKPRQQVIISDSNQIDNPVKVYLPDNNRATPPGRIIDAEV